LEVLVLEGKTVARDGSVETGSSIEPS